MMTSANLQSCSFIPLSDILRDAAWTFGIDYMDLEEALTEIAAWDRIDDFAEADRMLVSNIECIENLKYALEDAEATKDRLTLDSYLGSLLGLLRTQNAYVDIAN